MTYSHCQVCNVQKAWTLLDLSPWPSACEVDVIPLYHVPLEHCEFRRGQRPPLQVVLTSWSQEVGNPESNALIMPSHSHIEPKRCMGLLRELNPGPLALEARIIPLDQAARRLHSGEPTTAEHGLVAATY